MRRTYKLRSGRVVVVAGEAQRQWWLETPAGAARLEAWARELACGRRVRFPGLKVSRAEGASLRYARPRAQGL